MINITGLIAGFQKNVIVKVFIFVTGFLKNGF
jgi:hypothetical protein